MWQTELQLAEYPGVKFRLRTPPPTKLSYAYRLDIEDVTAAPLAGIVFVPFLRRIESGGFIHSEGIESISGPNGQLGGGLSFGSTQVVHPSDAASRLYFNVAVISHGAHQLRVSILASPSPIDLGMFPPKDPRSLLGFELPGLGEKKWLSSKPWPGETTWSNTEPDSGTAETTSELKPVM